MGCVGHPHPMSHASRLGSQGRRWCLTLYTDEDLATLRECAGIVAFVCAREEGSEEKKEHYQIYVKFESNKRWSWWEKLYPSTEESPRSAHWELAVGEEWKCRRYIVDVASYLRDNPRAHHKTQGVVLYDFGCEAHVDESAPTDVKVVKMLVDGAKLSQVFRQNPMYYFHNSRKIRDLHADLCSWREQGDDYKPGDYEAVRRRIKRPRLDESIKEDAESS